MKEKAERYFPTAVKAAVLLVFLVIPICSPAPPTFLDC